MDAKIDFIKEVTKLEIKEGNILVLKSESVLNDNQVNTIGRLFKEALPEQLKDKVKVIVTENIDIGILRTKLDNAD